MLIAFRLLTLLLAATPALAIAHDAFTQHVVASAAAIILALAAMGSRGEIVTLADLLKRFSLAILFPIVWMILQIVPLPFSSLANPIWSTASAALNEPSLSGRVSVDAGATIQSLFVYLTMLSLMISTATIARDRHRAETIFFVLSTVTTFISAEVLIGQLDAFAGAIPSAGTAAAASFVAMAMLSVLANSSMIVMAAERYLSRRELHNSSPAPLLYRLVLALSGIAISLAAMKSLASSSVLVAMMLGLATILFIAIVRRLGFQPWPSVILFVIFAGIAGGVAIPRLQDTASAGSAAAESLALAKRVMSDTPWPGSGVGTFRSLAQIYQDFGTAPMLKPPSTAISVAVEWGQPALVILVGFAIQFFVFTFRGAIRRGRDSFFPSLAAACTLAALCEAFFDPSLLSLTVQIIVAVIVGLGLTQSGGRTSGLE